MIVKIISGVIFVISLIFSATWYVAKSDAKSIDHELRIQKLESSFIERTDRISDIDSRLSVINQKVTDYGEVLLRIYTLLENIRDAK